MTNVLYLVLALAAAQAPGDGAAPGGYAPGSAAYVPGTSPMPQVADSYYRSSAAPTQGPVRTFLRSVFGPRQQPSRVYYPTPAVQQVPQEQVITNYRPPVQEMPQGEITIQRAPQGEIYQSAMQMPAGPVVNAEPPVANPQGGSVYSPAQPEQGIVITEAGAGTNSPLPNLQVAKKYEDKVGHETDYSWITGHLFYVHTNGGRWVLRYNHPGEVDKFGGSVVLAPGVEMRNFREGDLVCVFGEVLSEGRYSQSLGGALYRVNSITMVERADP